MRVFARPGSAMASGWGVNSMVFVVVVLMVVVLLFNLL